MLNLLPQAEPTDLLLHVPGIGGHLFPDRALILGLRDAGIHDDVVVYNWAGRFAGMKALLKRERHDPLARRMARLVVDHATKHPGSTITLMGHSGGAAMVVYLLERLPEHITVNNVVLMAPALSPSYDLSSALRRVRGKCYVYHSRFDVFILSAGTRTFGTMDGVKTDAAGLNGFKQPELADAKQYAKLKSIAYRGEWTKLGHFGDHIGMLSRVFASNIISPAILGQRRPRPTDDLAKLGDVQVITAGDKTEPPPLMNENPSPQSGI